MRSGARALAALLIVGAAASSGLTGVDSAAAAVAAPSGGCWSYEPSAAALTAPPASDISAGLAPWTTVADGGFLLESSGATAVGGSRTVTATISSGPEISPTDDVSGTASFVLSLDGTPLADPVTVPFEAEAGQPVEGLVAKVVDLPVGAVGAHVLRLDAVYFDVPAESLRVACNGQASEAASPGSNPATSPKPTDVTSAYTVVAGSSATVTSVQDQAVLDAARPGDTVSVKLAGLASSVPATAQLCATSGGCGALGSVMTGADGAATTSFMVPSSAPVGAGTLKVSDGTTEVSTGFGVLGVQVVAAAEELDAESTTVTLAGTGWDPKRDVTIRGYTGDNSSTAATSDPQVVAAVDAAGAFTAEFVVADEGTTSVIVDQARSGSNIGAVYLISGVIGGAGVGPDPTGDPDPTDDPESTDTPTTAPTTTPVAPPAVTAPLDIPLPEDIPLPDDIPVVDPPLDTAGEDPVADLSVTEARLDGEATLSELFGGSPQRDLVFLVSNVGDETVEDPVVRVSVGRSTDVEPQLVDAEVGDLDPGEQTVVTVPLELPMAAFGEYHVVGQVGDTELGAFEVEWTTYPWGLFVLNALALLLLGWGVRRRMALRRKPGGAALLASDSDAVVDLAAADAWWAYRSGTGPRPAARAAAPVLTGAVSAGAPAGQNLDEIQGDAIVDLDAAEKWWGKRVVNGGTRAS